MQRSLPPLPPLARPCSSRTRSLFHVRHQLFERRSPAVVKAHLLMLLAAALILMHDQRGVARTPGMRLHRNHGRKTKWLTLADRGAAQALRTKPRPEHIGPGEPPVFDNFEIAADIGMVLSLGGLHHGAKDAAGTQIDFAIHGFPRRRGEPVLR